MEKDNMGDQLYNEILLADIDTDQKQKALTAIDAMQYGFQAKDIDLVYEILLAKYGHSQEGKV